MSETICFKTEVSTPDWQFGATATDRKNEREGEKFNENIVSTRIHKPFYLFDLFILLYIYIYIYPCVSWKCFLLNITLSTYIVKNNIDY